MGQPPKNIMNQVTRTMNADTSISTKKSTQPRNLIVAASEQVGSRHFFLTTGCACVNDSLRPCILHDMKGNQSSQTDGKYLVNKGAWTTPHKVGSRHMPSHTHSCRRAHPPLTTRRHQPPKSALTSTACQASPMSIDSAPQARRHT